MSEPYADLIAALARVHAQPLWDRYHRITTRAPVTPVQAMRWAWTDMRPLIERAVQEVSMQDAERRVLLLSQPDAAAHHVCSVATTRNLSGGLQTLLPGESARAHRHTFQAIRFMMQGSGAVTEVNAQMCPMEPGDFVLTPAWTWHGHTHGGSERSVWFDGLDLPLCTHFDSVFFELPSEASRNDVPHVSAPSRARAWQENMVSLRPDSEAQGSQFRYSAERAAAVLAQASPASDGSRLLRYLHATGGAALPTLDCYQLALRQGQATQRKRSTSSAICVVAQGTGVSTVDGRTLEWQCNDVFTVPHWQSVSHEARTEEAKIFMMTDRELLAMLGYLREENL